MPKLLFKYVKCLIYSPIEIITSMFVVRYWPKFLSEKGNDLMMTRLRKYCRWHQKQVCKRILINLLFIDDGFCFFSNSRWVDSIFMSP